MGSLEEQGAVHAAQVPLDGLARVLRPVEGRDGVVGDLLRARLEGDGEIVGAGEIVQQPRPRLGRGMTRIDDGVHGANELVVENVEAAAVVVLLEQLLESATGGGGIVVGDRPFEALRARRRRIGGATTRSIGVETPCFLGC